MSTTIIVPGDAENSQPDALFEEVPRTPTLHELHPVEVEFFKRRFVWSSQTKGFYTRSRYEAVFDEFGKRLPKWRPFKSKGRWQHLYPELVDSLVEKHLDFERFCRTCEIRDRLAPAESETAFWLGMMAGTRTYADCIDLDSHDVIGWNPVPTRWHPDRTGWAGGPYDYRFLPVIRPSLRFFQIAKVIHDTFPRRIWCFSSANLGLAIWEIYRSPAYNHNVYPAIEHRLQAAGFDGIEHYPCPAKTEGSLGKCHRRPCGMDSAVITDEGLITDPIEQIRCFMFPPRTPPFEQILAAYWERLAAMYDLFLRHGSSLQRTRLPQAEKLSLVTGCQHIVESVKAWLNGDCLLDWDLIHEADDPPGNEEGDELSERLVPGPARIQQPHCPQTEPPVAIAERIPETACPQTDGYPQCFYRADLRAAAGSGQWVQYVKFLIENGFPTDDKLCEVVSTLALWFGFIEFFGEKRQKTKDILRTYVLRRHNGKVTRLITGEAKEVLDHVDRIVDNALDNEEFEGKELFARLRKKRSTGQYQHVYNFAPQIAENYSSSYPPNNQPLHLICGDLIEAQNGQGDQPGTWHYEPDLTPLPELVISRIKAAFKEDKRQLRQNNTTGRYPTLDAITRLFNYLYCGRTMGSRRASQKLLVMMGFLANSSKRTPIFQLLERHRLLYKAGYLSKTKSRQWTLDRSVIEAIWKQRGGQDNVSS